MAARVAFREKNLFYCYPDCPLLRLKISIEAAMFMQR
jgi:hypothetical protein